MNTANNPMISTILRKFNKHELKKILFTLNSRKVKHIVILRIALLIAALINLPRTLTLFDVNQKLFNSFSEVSVLDIIIRFLFLFIISLISLELNTNWKSIYSQYSVFVRTSLTIVLNTILFLGIVQLFVSIYTLVTGQVLSESEIGFMYFVYFVILVITIFIARILKYQMIHHEDLLENEKLKQQNLQKELTALKNQINPHFLFNSLNSLNSIVRDNKDATEFIKKLSFMYRYILQSGERDVVSLQEELKFLDSYVHLVKTRYRDRFDINVSINEKYMLREVPPLALQLLVENAVKHNEISEKNPLLVNIYSKNGIIYVQNEIRLRTSYVDSTGNGLMNLDKRYFLLKKQHISISNKENIFCVKLPIN
ncbi:histidine kinase [uncultured Aquimarina sp.]|uniref:sensor histidine kinase n=1 Tax=uncultured Aquimarina sp. TaxID=575652 RepID=UPI00261DD220|nr:histidine kinase [uncultured Aquimarina sp.]